jgi:hypothetical protein
LLLAGDISTNDVQNKKAKWMSHKKSIACFVINGILVLLVIALTTSILFMVQQHDKEMGNASTKSIFFLLFFIYFLTLCEAYICQGFA